jgi:predicted membrane protein
MRKVICFLVFLLTPFFVFAETTKDSVDWSKIIDDEAKGAFWGSFFLVFKMFLPYLIALIVFVIILKKLEKKIIEWKNNKKK